MKLTVMEFLQKYPNGYHKGEIYLKPFHGSVVKIDFPMLWEMISLTITDELAFSYEQLVVNNDADLLVIEDEITYLRRTVKEQKISIKRLTTSLEYYREKTDELRKSLIDDIIHTFMPRGYRRADYLNCNNSTPYRRGIANSLFFLEKRGYSIPEDVKSFMTRYKTRKTTRRK